MPTALARDHQRAAELLAETVSAEVRSVARRAQVADIDGWWGQASARITTTVADGFDLSARLTAGYLEEAGDAAGFSGFRATTAVLDPDQLATALRVTGPVAFKQHMSLSGDPDLARTVMGDRIAGTAFRLARAGDRGTVFATSDASPDILVGFRRVAEAGACDFCLMLEGRGAVYFSRGSAGQVVGRSGRPRGTRALGRAFHDNCRCRVEEVWGSGDGTATPAAAPAPAVQATAPVATTSPTLTVEQLVDRVGSQRRRNRVARIRAEAAAERAARLNGERVAAGASGKVDAEVLTRWGVTEQQYLTARALTRTIKADIRSVAQREADDLGAWLFNNELDKIARPERLQRSMDQFGRMRSRRTQSGYDWLEGLDDAEMRRVRARMVDDDIYMPDVLAQVVNQKSNLDLQEEEAMQWLLERWLHEDGLRSLASGRLPKYVDPDSIIPPDYAMEGYDIARLFGVDEADAVGHVAQVQAGQARQFAERVLGRPSAGPAPWDMDTVDYVAELDEVELILADTQLSAGIDPGDTYRWAQRRITELVPRDLDASGATSAEELLEAIRVTAQLAGLLDA